MFPLERERKMPLNKQKAKRRTPTPDEQDEEFNREIKKTITLGDDFIPQFQLALKQGHINEKVEVSISQIVEEADKKRKEDLKKKRQQKFDNLSKEQMNNATQKGVQELPSPLDISEIKRMGSESLDT